MPRRGFIPKREVLADPIYHSVVVTKLINQIMLDGKRGVAQKAVYDAFETVSGKTGREAGEVFTQAMENIMPVVEVKARRVGGSTYQVPIEIRPERRQTLGLRWLVSYARSRSERTKTCGCNSAQSCRKAIETINEVDNIGKRNKVKHRSGNGENYAAIRIGM